METTGKHLIYTIGHSTHSLDDFIKMLQSFGIKTLADIRGLPGSRKFPQFDKENLEVSLQHNDIRYIHLKDLGGRRKALKDSKNTRWYNASFRGYADYMETEGFERGIAKLEAIALKSPTAYMCAEAVWWRCHRSMVSDYLKAKDWTVLHIMDVSKAEEHSYTSPARVVNGRVFYSD
ncbi:MAG: DUF488 domain-containing protein [Flavobacteriia bacterium]|nr:DUF488 domain-containing protein [Flavobacteriia bacterium]OJX37562.1 MAG: Fe-S cluster assembly protein HesB [Flavobacteriia bacterium 40-80]